ncbi:Probable 3-hydroxyisobutyrate dehydrogenase, mitochondrial [Gryllus bimaculatus]|nr:Probable 3-hydroxyisobutyrate dehydrogenase, mitochondrial [Gryllus bimaculatus]
MAGLSTQVFKQVICVHHIYNGAKRFASRIGFIGLGNMGGSMAKNLIVKGHRLSVFDTNPQAVANLVEEGAIALRNPADIAKNVECVITMLPNTSHVLETYQGENGIFQGIKAGTLLIDSSTIDPSVPKQLSSQAKNQGAVFLDAPVSGGVNAAKAGSLTFMVGGQADEFEPAKEILSCMGARAVYCGPSGSGQAAKLCNNMLLAISMIGTAEAMNLGIRLGLQPKLLAEIFNSSTGRCWSSEMYNPVPGTMENVPSANNYEGGFGTNLMVKDLGLAQDAATRTQTPVMLGSLAHQTYRIMSAHGFGNKDFSSVYKYIQEIEKSR